VCAGIGERAERREISMTVVGELVRERAAGKRGSWRAAATALWVTASRKAGHRGDVADAAAQLAAAVEADEAGAGAIEEGVGRERRGQGRRARVDGGAREGEEDGAARVAHASCLREREGGVTDDALAIAGGVAGVAQVEQARDELAAAGEVQEAAQGVGAAGLLGVDGVVEGEQLVDCRGVAGVGLGVGRGSARGPS
jgi:hypothetical protein